MTPESEPTFAAPWHARAFALTVAQNEAGHFSWSDWTARFSETLRHNGLSKSLNGGDDYFLAWLNTLESILVDGGKIARGEIELVKAELIKAHASTLHDSTNSLHGMKSD